MNKLIKATWVAGFLCLALPAVAQQGQGSQLEEAEIVIRKDRRITLPPATRNFEKIPQLPVSETDTKQEYTFKRFSYRLSPLEPTFRTVNFQGNERISELTSNFLKLGYGNYQTPYLEGYLGSKRQESYLFNLYVRHLSSKNGPVFDENSGEGRTEAAIGAKYFSNVNKVSGSMNYSNHKVHFYGYNPVLNYEAGQIEQKFTRFSTNVLIENANKEQNFDYHFKTDWIFFKDNFDARENKFNFDVGGFYIINDDLRLSADLLATLSKRQDLQEDNRSYLNFRPRVNYQTNGFTFKAGFNLAGDNGYNKGLQFYPTIKADYALSSGFRIYAGIDGDIEFNSVESSVNENPFLMANFDLRNTEKKSEYFGGLDFELFEGFTLSSGFSYASLNNLQFFTNGSDSTRFEILYEDGTTRRLNVFSAINFENTGKVRSSLRFDYFNYALASLEEAWHKPNFKTAFNTTIFPIKKLTVTTDLYYLAGLMALNRETAQTFELDDIIDLNLGGRYEINERFGVFLQINNLFGKEYERYLNYPSRGIQFLGGLSVAF
ncbi:MULTISPECIES: hypothetical protein [Roseivirga]|jgi:hypothetical protein|uniref:TonB-dependent receptor-like beta-barrel domain-containing protein n=1 Tax=Roseivirga thermotolerans TaxID=1758176 RepID=A0ABQ3ICR5_9BACT|nr:MULTISPECIES: hypothetical protein [Roseivirga]MEC7753264.1 hypothetical protein [Bacteroidota bacterium]GHE73520.1 hypothetical protein GCM10011340_32770 [Roseivirga thermotolerans]|tara:strand:+ start:4325 stop:5965 length:1641 start_codon:yes stop_codon:yes gene_type:complete